ncbi:polyamine-transporting ATPase 13A3 isoform X2 [Rhipicephalus microplus]|uniref:polyamine-transporting ATPase 13A3 isoform X2 n=1 Tax=Rhipicephalus microplus TaxID=6941 RepID=UPI003F6ADD41
MVYEVRPEDEILGFAAVIREGTDEPLEIYGYSYRPWKCSLYRVLCALTLGLLPLVTSWKPEWYIQMSCTPCQLSRATVVVIKQTHLRCFVHQHLRYIWSQQEARFTRLSGLDRGWKCVDLIDSFQGYSKEEQQEQSLLYGRNSMELQVKSVTTLLLEKVLHPFYVFQIASITVWILDLYYFYAGCIITFSATSITLALLEAKKQMQHLLSLVSHTNEGTAIVVRANNEVEEVPSGDLVPGDVICVPASGCLMTCDAVLTAGNCLVNESLLTGESVPVVKTPLLPSYEEFSAEHHRRHVLFRGTQVLQTRYYGNNRVTALVVRTGFSTAKGALVRSILFAQPAPFRFYRDAILFVLLLFAVASVGMVYTLYLYIIRQVSLRETVLRALDIVTIAVPPALPAAMTVASVYALKRLRRASIYCVSPHRINTAGNIDVVCFDKTGTLTDGGLELWGMLMAKEKRFNSPISEPCEIPVRSPFLIAMATCHTLTSVGSELVGDPLDLAMFRSTHWLMEEPARDSNRYDVLTPTIIKPCLDGDKSKQQEHLFQLPSADPAYEVPFEVGIIRQFPFSSFLQRMSVVCRTLGSRHMELYAKGAPEVMHALCKPETVPAEYYEMLRGYTLEGFRVVAVAYRRLEKMTWHHVQRVNRLQVENDLTFLGFLIMQNMLKPDATPVIGTLHGAQIRCVMVTGDHLMTALSVARDCDMVSGLSRVTILTATADRECSTATVDFSDVLSDRSTQLKGPSTAFERAEAVQFAVDGHSFAVLRAHFPDVYEKLLVKGVVFARMTPQQKVELVEDLQSIGYVVAMCGDGANDCGALKAADVGISLSEAEASIAAPFTSRTPSVSCVPTLIREGRCTLATSFSMFQFISLYSIIQFLSVILLYHVQTNFSDPMFLYVDLFVITSLAVTMSYAEPCAELSDARPSRSLLTPGILSSLLLQLLLVVLSQVGFMQLLQSQPWYQYPSHDPEEDVYDYWDVAALFFLTCYQYVVTALVFNRGPPFQKPFWTNYWFLGNAIVVFTVTTMLLFQACPLITEFFELVKWHPYEKVRLRLTILLLSFVHWALAQLLQMYIIRSTILKVICRRFFLESGRKSQYERVEETMGEEPEWLLSNATMVVQITNFDMF